jgi:uncharacterized delta-60 repeat protein
MLPLTRPNHARFLRVLQIQDLKFVRSYPWLRAAGLMALIVLVSGTSAVYAARSGDVDLSWGTAGRVSTSVPDHGSLHAVVLQPDGKVVMAGGRFDVVRYTANGMLDPTFGVGGKVSYPLALDNNEAHAVAVQPDGRIIVTGESDFVNHENGLIVMRLNPDGSLDPTFGGDGIVSITMGFSQFGSGAGVVVQSDGKIVAVGSKDNRDAGTGEDLVLVRLTKDGELDTGFAAGGIFTGDNSSTDIGYAIVLQPDGKILAGGTTVVSQFDTDFLMFRVNTNGTPDSTFGTGGKVVSKIGTSSDEIHALAVQPDGKIVAAGSVISDNLDLAIVRYNQAGQLDVGHFGSGGKLLVDFGGTRDSAAGVAIDPRGYIVAAGTSLEDSAFANYVLVRCEDDGDLDPTFGTNGKVFAGHTVSTGTVSAMALQPVHRTDGQADYKIIAAGSLGGPNSFTSLRFHSRTGPIQRATVNDFDGDGQSELALFRPTNGNWIIGKVPVTGTVTDVTTIHWGATGDKVAPGDYDGDGKYDTAVFRGGTWYVLNSSDNSFFGVQFGVASDIPMPADYDGDGRTDIGVFRPATGAWYYLRSSDGGFGSNFWGATGDIPTVGDFDGDDKADLAVFRSGVWYILQSSNSQMRVEFFGLATDKPVAFDYDNDGKTDIGVFRAGDWYYIASGTGALKSFHWGQSADIPLPGRYGTATGLAFNHGGQWWILDRDIVWVTGPNGDIPVTTYFAP